MILCYLSDLTSYNLPQPQLCSRDTGLLDFCEQDRNAPALSPLHSWFPFLRPLVFPIQPPGLLPYFLQFFDQMPFSVSSSPIHPHKTANPPCQSTNSLPPLPSFIFLHSTYHHLTHYILFDCVLSVKGRLDLYIVHDYCTASS